MVYKIYAKNTTVSSVSDDNANEFIELHHRSGSVTSVTSVFIGLFSKDEEELLAVAQFCSPRTSKKKREYSTELLRLAFKENVRVIGGASKLIKFYISNYDPADVFTYQDTTGEKTDVYEYTGFTLRSEEKKKFYLIDSDYKDVELSTESMSEARKNNKLLSVSYASKLGPDRILGTKLGEVVDPETGKRKTNIELFESLGWILFSTSGDRVYEWFNPNRTFYTYKITATDSNKYYYGVRHIKKSNATVDDCLNDGYYGSGGNNKNNKFRNWKKRHRANLVKEIIEIFPTKSKAYNSEKKLIGELYKTDKLCLNSTQGGSLGKFENFKPVLECNVHGMSKHIGTTCMKCISSLTVKMKLCNIHGKSFHQGDYCFKCLASDNYSFKNCDIHGRVKFNKNSCVKCSYAKTVDEEICSIHGKTLFKNGSCGKCFYEDASNVKLCKIHGETHHQGNHCRRCMALKNIVEENCDVHGRTKFKNGLCLKCSAHDSIVEKSCSIHGLVKFRGNSCLTCRNQGLVSDKLCRIHGETKFIGDSCSKCTVSDKYSLQVCDVHGEVQHNGKSCVSCVSLSNFSVKFCDTCNCDTKHNGNSCMSCSSAIIKIFCSVCGKNTKHKGVTCLGCSARDSYAVSFCDVHGESQHKGGTCLRCVVKKSSVAVKECDFHGFVKHNGNNCYSCRIEKTSHTRFHKNKINESCRLCEV